MILKTSVENKPTGGKPSSPALPPEGEGSKAPLPRGEGLGCGRSYAHVAFPVNCMFSTEEFRINGLACLERSEILKQQIADIMVTPKDQIDLILKTSVENEPTEGKPSSPALPPEGEGSKAPLPWGEGLGRGRSCAHIDSPVNCMFSTEEFRLIDLAVARNPAT